MPRDIRELITESVDAAAADAWSKFTVGEADKLVLHEAALPAETPGDLGDCVALFDLVHKSRIRRRS